MLYTMSRAVVAPWKLSSPSPSRVGASAFHPPAFEIEKIKVTVKTVLDAFTVTTVYTVSAGFKFEGVERGVDGKCKDSCVQIGAESEGLDNWGINGGNAWRIW